VVTGGFGNPGQFARSFPAPIEPENLPVIDCVFITHAHADHCDIPTLEVIYRKNPGCLFIGPPPVEKILFTKKFLPVNIVRASVGGLLSRGNIEFRCVPAAHYALETDEFNGDYSYVGYLIKVDDMVIYHAGDTVLYPGLVQTILASHWQVNVACLPVNGRDERRDSLGIVGNLNADEALALATEIKARYLIPLHNDLFLINQEDPQLVAARLSLSREVSILQMSPGESANI
jgi:L-ascorbate metabolism protein UlaG (beta-lactamase superfamily)